MNITNKEKELLLEALEDLMYKLSLELEEFKGRPLTARRKELTNKQKALEALQNDISNIY
jgi:hypothetical protein